MEIPERFKRQFTVTRLPNVVVELVRPVLEATPEGCSYAELKCEVFHLFPETVVGEELPIDPHSVLADAQTELRQWQEEEAEVYRRFQDFAH